MTRASYAHFLTIPTRWMDNDVYGHVNNVVYYSYFDTVINRYLIEVGGFDLAEDPIIGVCAESQCRYADAFSFPEAVEAGLRIGHLGRTSVRYEIGLFKLGAQTPAAEGAFVHVFVDRQTRTPAPIPGPLRTALWRLVTDG